MLFCCYISIIFRDENNFLGNEVIDKLALWKVCTLNSHNAICTNPASLEGKLDLEAILITVSLNSFLVKIAMQL